MLSDDHLDTLASADNIVGVLWALGKFEPARQLGEDTLARYCRVLGDDHPLTLRSAAILNGPLRELGQYRRARQLGEDTLTRCRPPPSPPHSQT